MAEPERLQTIVDAAERAAGAKDFAAAERLLREALQLQEAELGPHHPDLANTLNNLGVVCEMAGQPAEAESSYRRAYAIAAGALPSDHPFVITSRANLTEFCTARGKPVALPEPVRPATAADPLEREQNEPPGLETPPVAVTTQATGPLPTPETPQAFATPPAAASTRVDTPAGVSAGPPSRLAIIVVGVVVLMLIVVASRRFADRGDSAPAAAAPTNTATAPQAPPAAPPPSAAPASPPAVSANANTTPSSGTTAPPSRRGDGKPERGTSTGRGAAAQRLAVATALLCQRFAPRGSPDWQCEPARGPVARGTFVFYTRIRSARPTTVQHRWYRGDELHQSVSLDVSANQAAGYRTYSRYTVPQAGGWRVELRTTDGALLHEERFEVR